MESDVPTPEEWADILRFNMAGGQTLEDAAAELGMDERIARNLLDSVHSTEEEAAT